MEWEIEDIGIHAHIKVKNTEDDMIAIGVPHSFAMNIVNRHNEVVDNLLKQIKFCTDSNIL